VQRRLREGCSLEEILAEVEKKAIREAISLAGGDMREAASMLRITAKRLTAMARDAEEDERSELPGERVRSPG
jgi:DNA-binding NtrC family response regulator